MKKFTTTITTVGGAFEFNDTNIPNSGTTVLNQFNDKQTIHSFVMDDDEPTEIYIPFHAINYIHSSADIVEDTHRPDLNCEGPGLPCTCENLQLAYNDGTTSSEVPFGCGTTIHISSEATMAVVYTGLFANLPKPTVTSSNPDFAGTVTQPGETWVVTFDYTVQSGTSSDVVIHFNIPQYEVDCDYSFTIVKD